MKLTEFDYALPKDRIAQFPPDGRSDSRLLALDRSRPDVQHLKFPDLIELLRPDDLLVLNDTRVFPARLRCFRTTGGRVDALLVRKREDRCWEALLDTPRRLRIGERLKVADREWMTIASKEKDRWILEFDGPVESLLEKHGRMPLPPYIKRDTEPSDGDRYQTIYAARDGAIAAPTAGLHFTSDLLSKLPCPTATVTLHVGTGTFKPVKCEEIEDHVLDAEWYQIPEATVQAVRAAARVVAVGTTSCRTLESWSRSGQTEGWSDLFIYPPFEFQTVGALVTNFHVPKSTLLMLVSAFAGRKQILAAYQEALNEGYRFFSYGDAMFLS